VDLGSEERHHPVENPQLKEYKAKLTIIGAVINSTLLSDPHSAQFRANLPQLFAQVERPPLRRSPPPFQVFVDLDS
jgi:hypothetical protein